MVHERRGLMTGKSHVHARVDHGFHEHKDIGRAGSGNGSGHVDKGFVVDVHRLSKTRQDFARQCPLVGGQIRSATPYRHALTNRGGRIGHAAHHLGQSALLQDRYRRSGNDGQQNGIAVVGSGGRIPQLLQKGGRQILRLDGQNDQVVLGIISSISIMIVVATQTIGNGLRRLHAIRFLHARHGVVRHVVDGELIGSEVQTASACVVAACVIAAAVLNHGFHHGRGHHSGPNDGDLVQSKRRRRRRIG
mmetsp:Transcript_19592/g.42224  ORF Transcript_19592/g.42224 Transcript_19592/m.42224 type:complete len:248 (+) Transcript_19592:391-1134(+)